MTSSRAGRAGAALLLALALAATTGAAATAAAATGAAAGVTASPPGHTVTVSGPGVATYPAFDPSITRYALTTTDDTAGTVTVAATTSDPTGTVWIDGVPDDDGAQTLHGLGEGDEVAVWVQDGDTVARYSFVYLPAGFPTLQAQTAPGAVPAPGAVLLGLSNTWLRGFGGQPGRPDFVETAVDRYGVPLHVESFPALGRSLDLKRQPDGNYSVARTTTTPGRTGETVIELDERFEEVDRHETVGLINTDAHDSVLLPDGTAWLMAYEPNPGTGLVDSVIQRVDPDGSVGFEWTSAPYAAETVAAGRDYAHLNSFELTPDGDLLASFRNLDAVFLIATSTHDGFAPGDVVWKLGGRDSDFAITDATGSPDGGPCAQHSAHLLPDGDVVLFDNGSSDVFEALCLRPGDPSGPTVQRVRTRILTLHLDPAAHTATIERSFSPDGRFAWFAGSTQPLPGDGLLLGWAASTAAVATELDAAGAPVWELRDTAPDAAQRFFSYRAQLADVPDATAPEVAVETPAPRAVYELGEVVQASYRCTDRGGSSLQECVAGAAIDTSVAGSFGFDVTASDGAGNTTTVTRPYTVRSAPLPPATARPDVSARLAGRRGVGQDVYGDAASQRLRVALRGPGATRTLIVRLENDGARPDRLRYAVRGPLRRLDVPPLRRRGRTGPLQPGEHATLRFSLARGGRLAAGERVTLRIRARSAADRTRSDAVSVRVVAR